MSQTLNLNKPFLSVAEASIYSTFSISYLRKNQAEFISKGICFKKNDRIIYLREKLDKWLLGEKDGFNSSEQQLSISQFLSERD